MNTKLALSIAAFGFAGLAPLSHAQAQSADSMAQAAVAPKLTRAEVRADFALWRRAGLDTISQIDGYILESDEVERRTALYRQWRSGPEFQQELARQQGRQPSTAQAPSAQTLN
jgi:hypothetical protein